MATVRKWGNSLAVRIPAALAEKLEVRSGTSVEITAKNGSIIITPRKRSKYTLRELLKGCKPGGFHGEVDWGPDVGREVID
jgi:antitoxin MazE